MVKHFPELIDPFKFARQAEKLHGKFPVAQMKRLSDSLDSDGGDVEFELTFDRKERARVATGSFRTDVKMVCQRCLDQVNVAIRGTIHLEFVEGEEAEGRFEDQGYETVIVKDNSLSLLELIEDEVILALPFSPLHEKGECPGSTIVEKLQVTNQNPDKPNPFAVLAKLKKDQE